MEHGETDRTRLLAGMAPYLHPDGPFVFVGLSAGADAGPGLRVVARVEEDEGPTLVVPAEDARAAGHAGVFPCARITLRVHSALDAVGFLAVVTTALADAGIGTNPVAGFHHDHLFVPWERRVEAMTVLHDLAARGGGAR